MKREMARVSLPSGESVSAILDLPPGERPVSAPGVIIAHGVGNDMENPILAALADGMAGAGCPALRFNFPFKEKGLNAPDRPEKLEETMLAAYRYFREGAGLGLTKVIAAGKSMGGRIASQTAAEGKMPVEGLIFLGYPLHHAGDTTMTADTLHHVRVPMLFFAGTRDPFCDLELLKSILAKSPVYWKIEVIEGGDHCFNLPEPMGIGKSEVFDRIVKAAVQWMQANFTGILCCPS